jgi:hypothetical protein
VLHLYAPVAQKEEQIGPNNKVSGFESPQEPQLRGNMKRSEETLIQLELSRETDGKEILQVVWVPETFDGKKLKVDSQVKLDGEDTWWTIKRAFTTMPREVLEQNRGWRVGGIDSCLV